MNALRSLRSGISNARSLTRKIVPLTHRVTTLHSNLTTMDDQKKTPEKTESSEENTLAVPEEKEKLKAPPSPAISSASSDDIAVSCLGGACRRPQYKPQKPVTPPDGEREPKDDIISNISSYLSRKLRLGSDSSRDGSSTAAYPAPYLEEPTLDAVVKYIQSDKCRNIIVMAGAGISTSAGIPDFRSPTSGLYSQLGKYNLPYPEAVFDINYFRRNPKPFFDLARDLIPRRLKPTKTHLFLRLLSEKGLLLRLYTQNIDTLEREAGIPVDKLVEGHGTFHTSHCLECSKEYSIEWMKERLAESDLIPKCDDCGEIVKPDVVFFGENLPERFHRLADEDFAMCDLLIIIGTSLQVQPFAGLVDRVHSVVPRLLINLEKCGQSRDLMTKILGYGCGLDFDSEDNNRDVALLGTCDDGCDTLVKKLGWETEFDELLRTFEKAFNQPNTP